MKATILHISKNENHILVNVRKSLPNGLLADLGTGFIQVDKEAFNGKVGDVLDIPFESVSISTSEKNGLTFNHITFS